MAKETRRAATGGRDAAGIGPHLREGMRLVPLKELDGYRLAEGEPDIRGWEVQTVSGRKIGEVEDLLVEQATGEVVLLDVDLDGTRRRTLAPARAVQLQRERRVVLVDSTDIKDAEHLPNLARTGEVTADELRIFREGYAQLWGARAFHDQQRDYEIQRREGGTMRLGRGEDLDRDGVRDRDAARDAARDTARDAARDTERDRELDMARADEVQRNAERREEMAESRRADATVRFPRGDEEVVVERRPVVMEEVVVRRRVVDPNEATDAMDADRLRDRDAVRADTDRSDTHDTTGRPLTDAERRARELRDEERLR